MFKNIIPECPRCGKNFEQTDRATMIIDNIEICDECFTEDELEDQYKVAHYLKGTRKKSQIRKPFGGH